ncbi:MAG: ATP-binding cassette domain-containing protein [Deltaproteobacteria bacterium]|nr:ATP-binding cassette domain-containing protein [Deltaproteobacteria bacterium]
MHEGEVFGFFGPNGAGKSTAIKILLNLIFPSLGKAEILVRSVGLLYFGFLLSLTQIRLNAKLHSGQSDCLRQEGQKIY